MSNKATACFKWISARYVPCLIVGVTVCLFQTVCVLRDLHNASLVGNEEPRVFLPPRQNNNTTDPIMPLSIAVNSQRPSRSRHHSDQKTGTFERIMPSSPYAYTFIIGGIHEDRIAYKGFLYNVLLATHILQTHGSKADVLVYLQFSPDSKIHELPTEEAGWLKALGISTLYLPLSPSDRESFAGLMLDKFQALKLTQYRRIMYLDSDVLPLCNLDYLFQLSDPKDPSLPTILRPNVLLATAKEPANGGFFLMNPSPGAWESLSSILERQKEEGKRLPYPHFNFVRGWGHSHRDFGDSWHAIKSNGTRWRFHGGHSDQGLLYYFFKYIVQDTSIFVGSQVEHWTKGRDQDHPKLYSVQEKLLLDYAPIPDLSLSLCKAKNMQNWTFGCHPPYRDFMHYTGKSKPWQRECKQWYFKKESYSSLKEKFHFWFVELRKLNDLLDMKLDFKEWNAKYLAGLQESPLGYLPMPMDNSLRIMGNESNLVSDVGLDE